MPSVTSPTGRPRRRALTLLDVFLLLAVLALAIFFALPMFTRSRVMTKIAVCASNVRGVGQGLMVYANDNYDFYPHHYFEIAEDESGPLPDHGVSWVGMMGSNEALRIDEQTSPDKSPRASHPSRSLFLLITDGCCTSKQFNCPESNNTPDDLRKPLPNPGPPGATVPCAPGIDRFDFRGYTSLSYGYQLPYGPLGAPSGQLESQMVLMADKGPYYEAGEAGLPGTQTVRDRLAAVTPPSGHSAEALLQWTPDQWRPYNSRLHGGEGQNVLYADGHVKLEKKPCVGINFDNIYTIQRDYTLADTLMGKVPDAHETIGPFTNTDSFIVP